MNGAVVRVARSPQIRAAAITSCGLACVGTGYYGPWTGEWTWMLATVGWAVVGTSVVAWANAFRFGTDDVAMVRHVSRWAAVAAGTPIAVVVCDDRDRIVWCSSAWSQATGIDARRAIGEPLWDVLHVPVPSPFVDDDVHVLHPSGRRRWMHFQATPVTSETGRAIGTAWFVSDAEARRESQEHERRAFEILRASSFASEQFVRQPHWSDAVRVVASHLIRDGYRVNIALYRLTLVDPSAGARGPWDGASDPAAWIAERYASFPPGPDDVEPIDVRDVVTQLDATAVDRFEARAHRFPTRVRLGAWASVLARGPALAWGGPKEERRGHARTFEVDTRSVARVGGQDVPWPSMNAVYLAPIHVGDDLWGAVAFESDVHDMQWTPVEQLAFRTSADALSAAIERSMVEEALDRERTLATHTLSSIHQGVAVIDPRGKVQLVNPALASILGTSVDALAGHDRSVLGLGVSLGPWRTKPARNDHDHTTESFECRGSAATGWVRIRDGTRTGDESEDAVGKARLGDGRSTLHVHASERTVAPLEGHVIVIVTDVTERTRMDDELRDALTTAHAANLTKSRFLASVSHELRTPMNAVLGYAQLASLDATDDGQRDALARITSAGRHMTSLIEDLLDVAAAEAGLLDVRRHPVDLVEATSAAVDLVTVGSGRATASHTVQPTDDPVRVTAPGGPVTVDGDRRRIVQVVSNLVDNALKFGPPHEPVDVHVSTDGPARRAVVEVTDAGTGLSPEDVDRLFEPFARGATTRKPGRGIGLSVCKALVEAMGGTIAVTRPPDGGCTFVVTFPLLDEATSYITTVQESVTASR